MKGEDSPAAGNAPASPPPRMRPWRAIILYTRGLILNQQVRRTTMFYVVIVAMLMAFFGEVIPGNWLDPHLHLGRFFAYWLACAWLTLLAALLALYDMLMLRIQHRLVRRELRARMLGEYAEHD